MGYKVHEAFPLIVYQGEIECHKSIKEQTNELRDYWFNGYENESPEYSGKIFVHKKDSCKSFFNELRTHIDNYFNCMNVDYSKLSYHIIKSWVGYHKDNDTPSIKPHNHNECNLSFVYYLNTDKTSDKFCIVRDENPNECVGDLFSTSINKNLITKYNKYNCDVYTITPTEGTVVIFPSKIGHFTQQFTKRIGERIVIAGDITVTLKHDSSDYHQGSTHPSQWLEI